MSMTIDKTYDIQDADGVGGVAFDGTHVWFTTYKMDGTATLVKLDPETGERLSTKPLPALTTGIAWDGSHVWGATRAGLHRIDPETTEIVRTLPLPDTWFISGLAWDGGALWVGARDQRRLHQVDPETGRVLKTVNSDRLVTGITWAHDELWHAFEPDEQAEAGLRKIDGERGVIERDLASSYLISGLCFDGKRFWAGDCRGATLRAMTLS